MSCLVTGTARGADSLTPGSAWMLRQKLRDIIDFGMNHYPAVFGGAVSIDFCIGYMGRTVGHVVGLGVAVSM